MVIDYNGDPYTKEVIEDLALLRRNGKVEVKVTTDESGFLFAVCEGQRYVFSKYDRVQFYRSPHTNKSYWLRFSPAALRKIGVLPDASKQLLELYQWGA